MKRPLRRGDFSTVPMSAPTAPLPLVPERSHCPPITRPRQPSLSLPRSPKPPATTHRLCFLSVGLPALVISRGWGRPHVASRVQLSTQTLQVCGPSAGSGRRHFAPFRGRVTPHCVAEWASGLLPPPGRCGCTSGTRGGRGLVGVLPSALLGTLPGVRGPPLPRGLPAPAPPPPPAPTLSRPPNKRAL